MVASRSLLAVLFLALAQFTFAGNAFVNRQHDRPTLTRRTNAARMAAGLAPNPPRHLESRTYNHGPSPPKPSSTKPDCDDKKEIRIKCNKKGGGFVGYISRDYSSKDTSKKGFGLCNDRNSALQFDFENSVTPFDLRISSRQDHPYLGWSGNNLGSGTAAVLTGTKKTNINASPSNVGNAFSSYSANSESQVWYYTRNARKFEAKWVNVGGSRVDSKTYYNPDDDLFYLVTDTYGFLRKNTRAYEVDLILDD